MHLCYFESGTNSIASSIATVLPDALPTIKDVLMLVMFCCFRSTPDARHQETITETANQEKISTFQAAAYPIVSATEICPKATIQRI